MTYLAIPSLWSLFALYEMLPAASALSTAFFRPLNLCPDTYRPGLDWDLTSASAELHVLTAVTWWQSEVHFRRCVCMFAG